jgi:hypothetical protein
MVRNETKRNETKRNETKRNETKRNETKRKNGRFRTTFCWLCVDRSAFAQTGSGQIAGKVHGVVLPRRAKDRRVKKRMRTERRVSFCLIDAAN